MKSTIEHIEILDIDIQQLKEWSNNITQDLRQYNREKVNKMYRESLLQLSKIQRLQLQTNELLVQLRKRGSIIAKSLRQKELEKARTGH